METGYIFRSKVFRHGNSLCFTIPVAVARILNINKSTLLHVSARGDKIIFRIVDEQDRHGRRIVKPQRIYTRRSAAYYIATIPTKYAKKYSLQPGNHVEIKIARRKMILRKSKT